MTVTVVDPIGAYNTANGTSWDSYLHVNAQRGIYIPATDEFWFMLETKHSTPTSGGGAHQSGSRILRINQTTGAYIGIANQPAGQTDKLWLWGPMADCVVAQKVVVAGSYMTTVGGTTVGGHCVIGWNYDGTVAFETFWTEFAEGGGWAEVTHIISNPTRAEVYIQQRGNGFFPRRFRSLNMTTGVRGAALRTDNGSNGNYRPSMTNDGSVWVAHVSGATDQELRLAPTTLAATVMLSVTGVIVKQVYDPVNDRAWFSVRPNSGGITTWRYWDGASIISVTPNAMSDLSHPNTHYEWYETRTGYFAFTRLISLLEVYLIDLDTLVTVETISEPNNAGVVDRWMMMVTPTRGWWAIAPGPAANWTFGIWTPGSARRVSLCVIT